MYIHDVSIQTCDPRDDLTWCAALETHPAAHLGQAREWFTVISTAYSHTPFYLKAEDSSGHVWVLPAFLIRRPLLGSILTSMPFLDSGGPCGEPGRNSDALVNHLVAEAKHHGASRVELRCIAPMNQPFEASLEKVTLVLPLPSEPDRLWRDLGPKVRNQIRKAERGGLTVEVGGIELLDEFYRVFAVNMRDLGSPVHAKKFFRAILETFGKSAQVGLARKDRISLGGLISVVFNDTMYVPWASSLREYASLCPNMLLYWDALRRACEDGLSRFDFGRSSRGSGTYRFKRQWGADEVQLHWYTIPIGKQQIPQPQEKDGKWEFMSRLWTHLPVTVSRILGPRIRRYLTQ